MTIQVTDIGCMRDGGTITFSLIGTELAGKYRLRTPFQGEPRPLFRNERKLRLGGTDEARLLASLREWFAAAATPDASLALARLDELREWRNLSADLLRVVPLHRMGQVIRCLEARAR